MQLSASQLTPQTHTWLSQRPKECSSQLLVGQQRALNGLTAALRQTGAYGHCFAIVPRGFNHREVFDECFATTTWQHSRWFDWLYLAANGHRRLKIIIKEKAPSFQWIIP